MDLRVPMDAVEAAFGVSATVTPPGGSAVALTAIWDAADEYDEQPVGREYNRRQPNKRISIKREAIAAIPRGSLIVAPEKRGGESITWQVDGVETIDADHYRLEVVRQTTIPSAAP